MSADCSPRADYIRYLRARRGRSRATAQRSGSARALGRGAGLLELLLAKTRREAEEPARSRRSAGCRRERGVARVSVRAKRCSLEIVITDAVHARVELGQEVLARSGSWPRKSDLSSRERWLWLRRADQRGGKGLSRVRRCRRIWTRTIAGLDLHLESWKHLYAAPESTTGRQPRVTGPESGRRKAPVYPSKGLDAVLQGGGGGLSAAVDPGGFDSRTRAVELSRDRVWRSERVRRSLRLRWQSV